jgi:hypothetical protein
MASELHHQLERQHLLAPPELATNGAVTRPRGRESRTLAGAPSPLAAGSLRIVRTSAAIEVGGVVALFTLDGKPHPAWQGAFVRAFEGTLGDAAGRWRFDASGIAVTRVQPGRAADVAAAVQAAVDAANGFLATRADEASAAAAAALALETDLQGEAVEAAAAMHAALGV